MKPVKWETVKLRAKREANLSGTKGWIASLLESMIDGSFDWRTSLENLQELVWDRIEKWDIREVKKLHDIFPRCLPKDCRYVADLRDDGEWWIIE